VAAVPIDSPLDAPYRHLAAQFAAFDIFFVDSVLAAMDEEDAQLARQAEAEQQGSAAQALGCSA